MSNSQIKPPLPPDVGSYAHQPHSASGMLLGPILSFLGLLGWCMLILAGLLIWKDYQPEQDVLALHLIGGGLLSVVLTLVIGAVSCTLAVIGLILSLVSAARHVSVLSVAGIVAGLLGLSPVVWVIYKFATA